eukprot:PLAT11862.1.p1 GENE.PLAT11862.1~~PLAT11862.1.p1  ORF type:complete len:623 (+),score=369.30 PLAT11862.1:35-1903(+)
MSSSPGLSSCEARLEALTVAAPTATDHMLSMFRTLVDEVKATRAEVAELRTRVEEEKAWLLPEDLERTRMEMKVDVKELRTLLESSKNSQHSALVSMREELRGMRALCDDVAMRAQNVQRAMKSNQAYMEGVEASLRQATVQRTAEMKHDIVGLTKAMTKFAEELDAAKADLARRPTLADMSSKLQRNGDEAGERLRKLWSFVREQEMVVVDLREQVHSSASQEELTRLTDHLNALSTRGEMESVKHDLSRVLEAIDQFRVDVKVFGNEMDQHGKVIATKASKVELQQLEARLHESMGSKLELEKAVKPVTARLSQFLTKLGEMDHALDGKAGLEELRRLQRRLQEMQGVLSARGGGAAAATRGGGSGGRADAPVSMMPSASAAEDERRAAEHARMAEMCTMTLREVKNLHGVLADLRDVIVGKKGVPPSEQHPNHKLWQQMVAFRKLLMTSSETLGLPSELPAGGGSLAAGSMTAPPGVPTLSTVSAASDGLMMLEAVGGGSAVGGARSLELPSVADASAAAAGAAGGGSSSRSRGDGYAARMDGSATMPSLPSVSGSPRPPPMARTTAGDRRPTASPKVRHVFRTDIEKKRWESEEKQRWLVETRLGHAAAGGGAPLPSV